LLLFIVLGAISSRDFKAIMLGESGWTADEETS